MGKYFILKCVKQFKKIRQNEKVRKPNEKEKKIIIIIQAKQKNQ